MSKTLLQIVQAILTSASGDKVSSINDTEEATTCAEIVGETYENILVNSDTKEDKALFELTPFGVAKPTLMKIPTNANSIDWVKYDRRESLTEVYPKFELLEYLPLDQFLELMYNLPREIETNIGSYVFDSNGHSVEVFYRNDRPPLYYTSPDDNWLIFDSFLSTVETHLQNTKSLAYGKKSFEFQMEDNFVFPLNKEQSQLLLQEAKAQFFVDIRQMQNSIAERRARRILIRSQKHGDRVNPKSGYQYDTRLPNFGKRT